MAKWDRIVKNLLTGGIWANDFFYDGATLRSSIIFSLLNSVSGPSVGDYLAFIGRVSPEKEAEKAIKIARRVEYR
jgi:hypothetical protein